MAAPRPSTHRKPTTGSYSSTSSLTNPNNAALRGAALAFSRPAQPSRAQSVAHIDSHGAWVAAAKVGAISKATSPDRQRGRPEKRLQDTNLVGPWSMKVVTKNDASSLGTAQWQDRTSQLDTTQRIPIYASQMASHRAAQSTSDSVSLPHARSQSISAKPRSSALRKPAAPPKPRQLSLAMNKASHENELERSTDSNSTEPTTTLVRLFERKQSDANAASAVFNSTAYKPHFDSAFKPADSSSTSGGITSLFRLEVSDTAHLLPSSSYRYGDETNSPAPVTSPGEGRSHTSMANYDLKLGSADTPQGEIMSPARPDRPVFRGRFSNETGSGSLSPSGGLYNNVDGARQHRLTRSTTGPPDHVSTSSPIVTSVQARYNQLNRYRMTTHMTSDELANAMVASSLATSRHPSPSGRLEAPRRSARHHKSFSRTPSPTKTGLKKTLRKTASESSDEGGADSLHPYGKHKKKRHLRTHPNKHHEGDRKRWREAVTERERKRYEGVWAANKGLYMSSTSAESPERISDNRGVISDHVSNIIVRDIWSRSRLAESTLETIWDLVDNDQVGRLTKDEFVVGLWLIDQRLKGRKLPVKVSGTVWASVRSLQGIKIRK